MPELLLPSLLMLLLRMTLVPAASITFKREFPRISIMITKFINTHGEELKRNGLEGTTL